MEYAPRMGPIGIRAKAAIEQASGCEVYQVGDDQALISAVLDCGNGDLRDLTLECIAVKRQ